MPQDCVSLPDKSKEFWDPGPAVFNSALVILCLIGGTLVILATIIFFVDFKRSKPWKRTSVEVVTVGAPGAIILGLGIFLSIRQHAGMDEADGAEGLTGVATASGAIVTAIIAATTLYTVILLRKSVNEQIEATNQEKIAVQQQTEQLRATAIQNIGHEMMDVNRWMADHLDYREALLLPENATSAKGTAAAEIYADFIDQVMSQEEFLPEDHVVAWRSWFTHIIESWPQLRKFINESPNSWYLENMEELLKEKADAELSPTADESEDLSLWDEAARQKQTEDAEQRDVWNDLASLFDEFAESVKTGRVKPNDQHGFHRKSWSVGVGPGTCSVTKLGRWSLSHAGTSDGVRTRCIIGNSSKGLVDSQWLSGADPEQWRKALVTYIVQYSA